MRTTIRFLLLPVFLAALALNMTAAQSGQSLEGAWNVSVHFADPGFPPCPPAGALITATTGNQGFIIAESCFASEGAGYGSWIRTAPNKFSTTFVGNSFGPSGLVESTYKVRAWLSPGPANDMFSGPFRTEFFDLSGNAIGSGRGNRECRSNSSGTLSADSYAPRSPFRASRPSSRIHFYRYHDV